ncbi:hypothetical protein D3C76_1247390 [compost metagenome]
MRFPQFAKPLVLDSNRGALFLGDALWRYRLMTKASVAIFVRATPVDVQLRIGGEFHATGEVRGDVVHRGDGTPEYFSQVGQALIQQVFRLVELLDDGHHVSGHGFVVMVHVVSPWNRRAVAAARRFGYWLAAVACMSFVMISITWSRSSA